MKCPHCEYMHGINWLGDEMYDVDGSEGDFYKLPIEMQQKSTYGNYISGLYGCPSCKKTFIE